MDQQMKDNSTTLIERGASDANVEARLTHTENNFRHMDARFHWLETDVEELQRKTSGVEERLHANEEFTKYHVAKEGNAGHPIPQRNINPDRGSFPVQQQ